MRAFSNLAHLTNSGPEIWEIEAGRMTHKGKAAVIEDILGGAKSPRGSGGNTPVRSRVTSPAVSNAATPVVSGAEGAAAADGAVKKKKKKLTRNQVKAQEERRRLRKLAWLTHGGPKPEDTDSDDDR